MLGTGIISEGDGAALGAYADSLNAGAKRAALGQNKAILAQLGKMILYSVNNFLRTF